MSLVLVFATLLFACQATPSQYFLSSSKATWSQAKTACAQQGARLAVIKTRDDQAATEKLCATANIVDGCWVGLSDVNSAPRDGKAWVWVDGSTSGSAPMFWRKNQPDNFQKSEHCVMEAVVGAYKWNNYPCGNSLLYICEQQFLYEVTIKTCAAAYADRNGDVVITLVGDRGELNLTANTFPRHSSVKVTSSSASIGSILAVKLDGLQKSDGMCFDALEAKNVNTSDTFAPAIEPQTWIDYPPSGCNGFPICKNEYTFERSVSSTSPPSLVLEGEHAGGVGSNGTLLGLGLIALGLVVVACGCSVGLSRKVKPLVEGCCSVGELEKCTENSPLHRV